MIFSSWSSERRKAVALSASLILLLGVSAGLWRGRTRPTLPAARPSTMQTAYEALQQASATPAQVQVQHGIARFVTADIETRGSTPAERARQYLETFGALYGIHPSSGVELTTRRTTKLSDQETLVVFAERYQGLPVFGGELLVSLQNDRVYSTIGSLFVPRDAFSTTPTLNAQDALSRARTLVRTATASTYADPELEIFDAAVSDSAMASSSRARLAWRVFLATPEHREIHVDAQDGSILSSFATELEDYELDLQNANGNEATNANWCYYLTSDDDAIGDEDGLERDYHSDGDAVSAWWDFRNTYAFFRNTFRLDSYDNDGEEIEAYVHAGGSVVGAAASYNPGCDVFQFSNGNPAYDVTVHEFTHAVISRSSNLVYQNQPGALNESFADIMGSVADGNWLVGERRTGGGSPFRDMSDPPRFGDPDTMPPRMITSDNGGVHTNSGIHNKVAFLIAEGGVHNAQRVQGIGRPKLGQLMMNVMRTVPSSAQFNDIRNRAVAVSELWARTSVHGFTRQDACMVRNAYFAAGFRGADDTARADADCDGIEDNRDPDRDNDAIPDSRDNCPLTPNIDQADTDRDGLGNACDNDADNDGIADSIDNCPNVVNPRQEVNRRDGRGFACGDDDGDGVLNGTDNCFVNPNPDQANLDNDAYGDVCDTDVDGDSYYNERDNCPRVSNRDQADSDRDGVGNSCDNCPSISNRDQRDRDNDREGDVCDNDRDGDGIPNGQDDCPDSRLCVTTEQASIATIQIPPQPTPTIVHVPLTTPLCPTCGPIPRPDPPACHGLRLEGEINGSTFWMSDETGRQVGRFRPQGNSFKTAFTPEGGRTYTLNTFVPANLKASTRRVTLQVDEQACAAAPLTETTKAETPPPLPPSKEVVAEKEFTKSTPSLTEPTPEKTDSTPSSPEKTAPSVKEDAKQETPIKTEAPVLIPAKTEPEPAPATPKAPLFSLKSPTITIEALTPNKQLFYGNCPSTNPTILNLIFSADSVNALTTMSVTYQTLREDGSLAHASRNAQLFSIGNNDYAVNADTKTFALTDLEGQNGILTYQITLVDEAGLRATHTGRLPLVFCQEKK